MTSWNWSLLSCTFVAFALVWSTVAPLVASQPAQQIVRKVEQALRDESDFKRITVSVEGSEVTLAGEVPHLLAKHRAINRALEVDGIETVASELELPVEEEDSDVAQQVVDAINKYNFYGIWDDIGGDINQGVVTLYGSVTPDRDKKRELYETIAQIRGVLDYVDQLEVQAISNSDDQLRRIIYSTLSSNLHFARTITMRRPPYHIVVNRSVVTLVGYVQSEIEFREMERIITQTHGVLRVDNQLQVLR